MDKVTYLRASRFNAVTKPCWHNKDHHVEFAALHVSFSLWSLWLHWLAAGGTLASYRRDNNSCHSYLPWRMQSISKESSSVTEAQLLCHSVPVAILSWTVACWRRCVSLKSNTVNYENLCHIVNEWDVSYPVLEVDLEHKWFGLMLPQKGGVCQITVVRCSTVTCAHQYMAHICA